MHHIKKRNRTELSELAQKGPLSQETMENFLYYRYMHTKTVYDYFTTEEMNLILRKLPDGDSENDSVEFAEQLCEYIHVQNPGIKPDVIVNMCSVLALTASNKNMLEENAYSETIHLLCKTLANYIFGENR